MYLRPLLRLEHLAVLITVLTIESGDLKNMSLCIQIQFEFFNTFENIVEDKKSGILTIPRLCQAN